MRKNIFAVIAACICLASPTVTFAQPDQKTKPKPCYNVPGAMSEPIKNEASKQKREKVKKEIEKQQNGGSTTEQQNGGSSNQQQNGGSSNQQQNGAQQQNGGKK